LDYSILELPNFLITQQKEILMSYNTTTEESNRLVDRAAHSADEAIKATKSYANHALDSASSAVDEVRHEAAPLFNNVTEQAGALAQRGVDAVKESSQQLREKAQKASDTTVGYISQDPIKAMLIAAATGAALMALIGLMGRSRDRG
jgi:ElaB/YqjD/DUF883 family membrane-anchored ribosome-binding protein